MYRRSVEQWELRVLNHKEERDLQQKLNMLEKQYRYTRKVLQQRRDSLVKQERKVVMVKVCEPKATVNVAMKEIGEHKDAGASFRRSVHTSDGRRRPPSKSQRHCEGAGAAEPSRSTSAPTCSPRHRLNTRSHVSLMQMKNIAMIDSISEKELARQQQKAQEEVEKLRRLQRESLHNSVAAFIERLKEKGDMEKVVP
ncbi:uncharacterized protein LOC125023185 [Mugil cephalus]|uniref:uncharacterized protein LOC125023185 n=1 Tax=Mugil cephalus TaxID=48193 RepID=UPI001FB839C0|nr:uncharacterized protein LOC125023185 [Mugil cephalus]